MPRLEATLLARLAPFVEEMVRDKLRMALHNSVAIAAAFTRDPRLDGYELSSEDDEEYDSSDDGGRSSGSSSSSGGGSLSDAWSILSGGGSSRGGGGLEWPEPLAQLGSSLWGPRPPPRLVGFVRASGDYSLVGLRAFFTVECCCCVPALFGNRLLS
jgi:hypothetical protein